MPSIAIPVSLRGQLLNSVRAVAFSPSTLFALNEPGVWYDPSDLTTLFQDTAGTTPVTTPGQTVARINDKSGRGNNATQATLASRPTYGIVPLGGRRNLLTRTEEFDNAAWTKNNVTVTANAAVAPDGTTTADKIVEAVGVISPLVRQAATLTASAHTFTVYLKAAERSWVRLINTTGPVGAYFDLTNGLVGTVTAGATATISSLDNGWFRCSITMTVASGSNSFDARIALADNTSGYTGDGTSGILIWGAQLETGSSASAYQRVGSAFDVTEAGVASLSYLSFDGVDDFLITPTITPGIDKAQVFAGVRKLSNTPTGVLVEHSANLNTNNGSFVFALPVDVSPTGRSSFRNKGTTAVEVFYASAAPVSEVISGIGNISGDFVSVRANGVQIDQSTADQGTGNYLAYPLYIGRRGGTSLPFNGQLYSLLVRFGTNLNAGTITSTETWVGGKTGVTL